MGERSWTLPMFHIWQGGGLRIDGGTVSLSGCNIYSNQATSYVSASYLNFLGTFPPCPHGGSFREASLNSYLHVCVLWHVLLFNHIYRAT